MKNISDSGNLYNRDDGRGKGREKKCSTDWTAAAVSICVHLNAWKVGSAGTLSITLSPVNLSQAGSE